MKPFVFISCLFSVFFLARFLSFNDLKLPQGAKILVTGRIESEPKVIGNIQIFKINAINVQTGKYSVIQFGDRLEVIGNLDIRPLNKFVKEYWLVYPQIRTMSTEEEKIGVSLIKIKALKQILVFRRKLLETYNIYLPEPLSALLSGIVLGLKSQLPQDFALALRKTGTTHVVVASGMNLTFLMPVIFKNLSGLFNRFLVIIISILFMVFYCCLAGFEPPILRAAIMVGLSSIAAFSGRRQDGLWALVLAGVIMLLWQPNLLFSLSWQLSFAATGGIIFLSPMFKSRPYLGSARARGKAGDWFGAAGDLFSGDLPTTLSAQIGVLPIIVANFGEVSLISLLVNVLVLWTIPYLMAGGLVLALTGFIWSGLARLIAWLLWPLLFWFVKIIEFFGNWPLASVQVPKLPWWVGVGYYGVIGMWVWKKSKFKV